MAPADWIHAPKATVLSRVRELRSSDYTKTAVLGSRNVAYVKGVKLVDFFQKRGISQAEAEAIGAAMLRENLAIKAEVLDKNRRLLREVAVMPNAKIFDHEGMYIWQFEASQAMRNLLLGAVVFAFVGLVLFPVWPQFAKVGVWYVSMTLLLLLFGFIVVRLALFLILFGMGMDFWILPNFFADDLGIMDSFRPLYTFTPPSRENLRETWPYRFAVVVMLAIFVGWVVTAPTEFDVFVASNRKFVDELYEGTLLADKSQKEKDAIDKVRDIPDLATLERELAELEKEVQQPASPEDHVDALVKSAVAEDESEMKA